MNSILPLVHSLTEMFVGKMQEFVSEIGNVHMVWLKEIQQEANRMFSSKTEAETEDTVDDLSEKSETSEDAQTSEQGAEQNDGEVAGASRLQEMSPQSYAITPNGGNKTLTISKNPEDYGMDQNSNDSTDDESAPRKPIPSWAKGANLKQLFMKQYFNPIDVDANYGPIEPPRLENIFYKSKPLYFKRTSSAVWHSPPAGGK